MSKYHLILDSEGEYLVRVYAADGTGYYGVKMNAPAYRQFVLRAARLAGFTLVKDDGTPSEGPDVARGIVLREPLEDDECAG